MLAHPSGKSEYFTYEFRVDAIQKVIDAGIDGLEVYHRWNDKDKQGLYLELARKHNLLITGGSDNHGSEEDSENNAIGSYWCDWDLIKDKMGKKNEKERF